MTPEEKKIIETKIEKLEIWKTQNQSGVGYFQEQINFLWRLLGKK